MEELSIKVNIADRFYPLTIGEHEEETVRKAAKLINDKLKHLQQHFAVKDKQDMLSMISLEIATELLTMKEKASGEDSSVYTELLKIKELLNDVKI